MELQTHGARKYPTSALLRSSAGLGWSTISAELRSHGVSETPIIVPQHMELCLAVAGNENGVVIRTGAGQRQATKPRQVSKLAGVPFRFAISGVTSIKWRSP
jgi:AraC family transcriptional regulator